MKCSVEVDGLHAGEDVGAPIAAAEIAAAASLSLSAAVGPIGFISARARPDSPSRIRRLSSPGRAIAHESVGTGKCADITVCVHAVRCEDGCCRAHEELAVVAAVSGAMATPGSRNVRSGSRRTLRGASHGVDVHAVRARAERAAKACRPKGEVLEESVGERGLVPVSTASCGKARRRGRAPSRFRSIAPFRHAYRARSLLLLLVRVAPEESPRARCSVCYVGRPCAPGPTRRASSREAG